MSFQPGMHKPVPMESRVIVPWGYMGQGQQGTVVGVASASIIYNYIVLLDTPVESEFGAIRAVSVSGPELDGVDGTNWRLEP